MPLPPARPARNRPMLIRRSTYGLVSKEEMVDGRRQQRQAVMPLPSTVNSGLALMRAVILCGLDWICVPFMPCVSGECRSHCGCLYIPRSKVNQGVEKRVNSNLENNVHLFRNL